MNYTLLSLNVKHYISGGPLLSIRRNLTIYNFHLSHFSSHFLFVPQFLKIESSLFSKFSKQVIISSNIRNNVTILSCSHFSDIITSQTGSIFALENTNVNLNRCSFSNIRSLSSPACFKVLNSACLVNQCTFSSCAASGENSAYGNCYYCYNCDNIVKLSYTILCAPEKDNVGNSAIALVSSLHVSASYINSSKCHGQNGAASLTFRESPSEKNYISFLTVTDPEEHNALEYTSTKKTFITYANIIDSNKCSTTMIQNPSSTSEFTKCVFINPHSLPFSGSTDIKFTNCFTNDITIMRNCSLTESDMRISIGVIFYQEPVCGYSYLNSSIFSLLKSCSLTHVLIFLLNGK